MKVDVRVGIFLFNNSEVFDIPLIPRNEDPVSISRLRAEGYLRLQKKVDSIDRGLMASPSVVVFNKNIDLESASTPLREPNDPLSYLADYRFTHFISFLPLTVGGTKPGQLTRNGFVRVMRSALRQDERSRDWATLFSQIKSDHFAIEALPDDAEGSQWLAIDGLKSKCSIYAFSQLSYAAWGNPSDVDRWKKEVQIRATDVPAKGE